MPVCRMTAPAKSASKGIKPQARKILRDLPDSATWDDLMYHIYVRQKIEQGLSDIAAGRVKSHAAIKSKFGVAP